MSCVPWPGRPLLASAEVVKGWFAVAVTTAKVQDITPHDLRHTCASSLAVSAGVNVLALQRMLCRTSAKVTLDTYADLFDDHLDTVAVTLDSRYSHDSVGNKGEPIPLCN